MELRETSRRGGGSQAGRRWPGRVAARATEQLRGEGEEDDRGRSGGGLGRCWAARCWAAGGLPGEQQVGLLLFLIFLFCLFY